MLLYSQSTLLDYHSLIQMKLTYVSFKKLYHYDHKMKEFDLKNYIETNIIYPPKIRAHFTGTIERN